MKINYSQLKNISPRIAQSEPIKRCEIKECMGVCCSYGVWMDRLEVENIIKHAHLISPHLPEDRRESESWFAGSEDEDEFTTSGIVIHTAVLDDADAPRGITCIFRRKDHLCALQVAAIKEGLHPWHFKPFYCILHPLELDEHGSITLPDLQTILDEPASCLRRAAENIPLVDTFTQELEYIMGNEAFRKFKESIEKQG